MSRFKVSPEKEQRLTRTMESLGIRESDLIERFVLGSGRGGQKLNKTSSCVSLSHPPSGIEVKCQQTRSQSLNRYLARCLICERLAEIRLGLQSKRQQEIEKIRRQKRKRSHKQKKKMLAEKRRQAEKKNLRKPVGSE